MKKIIGTTISILLLAPPLAVAGVVMDMVTTSASGQETERSKIYAQSKMIRMDDVGGDQDASMIFRGNEFVYVDHEDKSYIVMDEAMLEEVSDKISEAMKEMEAQLANMPPEQRAMVEQMMKGRMQGMMGEQREAAPKPRVEALGSGKWQDDSCERYAIYERGAKTQEVCAADLDDIDGGEDVIAAFRSMAAYMEKLTESLPMGSEDTINPGELMDQIDGFPVHTIMYRNGVAEEEMSLDSVTEKDLDPNLFTVPKEYRRQDPFQGN